MHSICAVYLQKLFSLCRNYLCCLSNTGKTKKLIINLNIRLSTKDMYEMEGTIPEVVFYAEFESVRHFFVIAHQAISIWKKFWWEKAMNDFDAFVNVKSNEHYIFSIN